MTKKVKDLTLEEMRKICNVREKLKKLGEIKDTCNGCPLYIEKYRVCLGLEAIVISPFLYKKTKDKEVFLDE